MKKIIVSFGLMISILATYGQDLNYDSLLAKYNAGDRNGSTIRDLARKADQIGKKAFAKKIADQYINNLKKEELLTQDNIWFIYEFTQHTTDRGFAFMKDNATKIAEVDPRMGEKYSNFKVLLVIIDDHIKPFSTTKNGKADWTTIKKNLKPYGNLGLRALEMRRPEMMYRDEIKPFLESRPSPNGLLAKISSLKLPRFEESSVVSFAIQFYMGPAMADGSKGVVEKPENLTALANSYLENYSDLVSGALLNDYAWKAFSFLHDRNVLEAFSLWAKKAVEKEPGSGMYMDTYANLLYKLGDKDKALQIQAQAVAASPDNTEIKNAFEKMSKGVPTWK